MSDSGGFKYEGSPLHELNKVKERVLLSTEYADKCHELADIYKESRAAHDPSSLFKAQERLFHQTLAHQQARRCSKSDIYQYTLYNQLSIVCSTIADSIAWRVSNYNRFLVELLIYHNQTGALNPKSSLVEFEEARRITEEDGEYVILNDLTNCFRYGDLTVFGTNGLRIEEVKEAGKAAKDSRVSKQRREIKVINDFFSNLTSPLIWDGCNHHIISVREPIPMTYHEDLNNTIRLARDQGYAITKVNPFFY